MNKEDKRLLDVEVSVMGAEVAVKYMKSPGTDGLTKFLKYFWDDIQKLLNKACVECIQKGCYPLL